MEAIKNLRESSVLLSNTGIVSYSAFAKAIIYHPCLDSVEDGDIDVSDFENVKMVVENCARYTCIDLLVALDKWAVEAEYRVIFDAMMSYRNGTNDEFFRSEHRDEELSDSAPEEEHTCELSTLLSNLNMSSYDELAERIYSFSCVEECLYYDTDEEESMGWVEKIVLESAEARDRDLMAGISMFATEEEYRILYGKLCGMAQMDYWLDLDEELCRNAAEAAEEMKEDTFFYDELDGDDFEDILNEETGKIEWCRVGRKRLTDKDYEEMERLEADDNFHASLCEADSLPF